MTAKTQMPDILSDSVVSFSQLKRAENNKTKNSKCRVLIIKTMCICNFKLPKIPQIILRGSTPKLNNAFGFLSSLLLHQF